MNTQTTHPENMAQKPRSVTTSPTPWAIERTNANGWKGVGIKDAEGLVIAYMVMQPGRDNEMANARLIVDAVNAPAGQLELIQKGTKP